MTRRMWLMAGPLVGICPVSTTRLAAQTPAAVIAIPTIFSLANATLVKRDGAVKPELRHHRPTSCTEFQDVCTRVRTL